MKCTRRACPQRRAELILSFTMVSGYRFDQSLQWVSKYAVQTYITSDNGLHIAPRYLNDLVSLRVHPATVTVIGFRSSQTFITSVFLPFVFMPSSVAASCKRLTMSCNSFSVLAISTMSSAYRRLVIHLPPILNPPAHPSSALRINNSAIR